MDNIVFAVSFLGPAPLADMVAFQAHGTANGSEWVHRREMAESYLFSGLGWVHHSGFILGY